MGKLIVWNIMSLDGCFEGDEKWDLELHEHIWGEDLRRLSLQFGEEARLLVFGRVTYEGMASYWPTAGEPADGTSDPVAGEEPGSASGEEQGTGEDSAIVRYMNAIPKLVASRTLTEAAWNNTEVTADIIGELGRRKQLDEKPIYVFGSAVLTDSLLKAGLVDELLVGVAPVILGSGTPLFKPASSLRPLELINARTLDSGGVLLRYTVPRNSIEEA
ncbi:dihydrofolate reductase family protein [Brevibacterium daeguense]|uniref:Dihydrofolate reductase family protein n=1 Tax=Brevibacterium daeguense TaxID=909936 RepID=A0ABP8ENR0_9MICO